MYVHTIFIDYEQALRFKWWVNQAAVGVTLTLTSTPIGELAGLAPIVQTLDSAIHRIAQLFLLFIIHWIVIYPVDSPTQHWTTRAWNAICLFLTPIPHQWAAKRERRLAALGRGGVERERRLTF